MTRNSQTTHIPLQFLQKVWGLEGGGGGGHAVHAGFGLFVGNIKNVTVTVGQLSQYKKHQNGNLKSMRPVQVQTFIFLTFCNIW